MDWWSGEKKRRVLNCKSGILGKKPFGMRMGILRNLIVFWEKKHSGESKTDAKFVGKQKIGRGVGWAWGGGKGNVPPSLVEKKELLNRLGVREKETQK